MAAEANKKNEEATIRRLIEDRIKSLRDRDLEGIMSLYAPDVVSFDIVPPLQYIGAEAFRKVWEEVLHVYQGPINYEIHDLSVTVRDDIAFTHSINRISGNIITGQVVDQWVRWTACFQKVNGQWLLVHHHVSVPTDMATGKARLDLKP